MLKQKYGSIKYPQQHCIHQRKIEECSPDVFGLSDIVSYREIFRLFSRIIWDRCISDFMPHEIRHKTAKILRASPNLIQFPEK